MIVAGEFVALLETLTVPSCALAVVGAYVRFNGALSPGVSVKPFTLLLVVNCASDMLIPDSVTLSFPVFFRVALNTCIFPTVSLPKFSVVGVIVSVRVAVTPVPFASIVTSTLVLLVFTVSDPLCTPMLVGENSRLKCVVAPAANVSGTLSPLTWYPEPLTLVPLSVTLRELVFFS